MSTAPPSSPPPPRHGLCAEDLVQIAEPSRPRRRLDVIARILLDLIDLGSPQHDLVRFQPFRLLDHLPAHKDHGEDADHEVGEEEGGDVPLAFDGG